jgi:hypothetical protein
VVVDDAAGLAWIVNLGCIELHPHPVRSARSSTRRAARRSRSGPGVAWADVRRVALEVNALLDELGLVGWPKTSGSRGMHVQRAHPPRWSFDDVRRAALALSREIERRAPALATSKWWKEERHGVFLDYNQNAKDRTTCSAYSVRPLPDARVSTPLAWDEVPTASRPTSPWPTVPRASRRAAIRTRAWTRAPARSTAARARARDEAAGLGDAPWPPHFRRGRARRRASRRRGAEAGGEARGARAARAHAAADVSRTRRARTPRSAGLERWKARHPRPPAARRRRRAGRLDARPLVDLDAHPREPAQRARGDAPAAGDARSDDDPTRGGAKGAAMNATRRCARRAPTQRRAQASGSSPRADRKPTIAARNRLRRRPGAED